MNTKAKMAITTIIVGAAAFFMAPIIWPDSPGMPGPSPVQLPFFMLISAFSALLFGFGIAFLIFGRHLLQSATANMPNLAGATYLAIAWSLISWWPHENLHRMIGENFAKLLALEYGFHLTLYIASIIIAAFFWKALRRPA